MQIQKVHGDGFLLKLILNTRNKSLQINSPLGASFENKAAIFVILNVTKEICCVSLNLDCPNL